LCAEPMSWKFARSDGGIVTNCKSETAAEKPFFKNSWAQRRCLIPADGFYEWKQEGTRKQPYRFVLNSGEPFWFAGLWRPDEAQTRRTAREFVILTRSANADVAALHNRMPLILRADEIDRWLTPAAVDWIPDGIVPGTLGAYPVASLISKPGLETPECIAPFVAMAQQAELF
jgi:putative SOS response-associated peptidase YedK